MLSFRRFILIHNLWLVKISYFKCFIYFIQKQVEAFTVHLRLRFFFWRQIYKLYQSSDYIAESVSPFHGVSVYWGAQVLIEFFFHLNPCRKINFPAKKLRKIRAPKIRMRRFFFLLGDVNKINLFVFFLASFLLLNRSQ